MRRGNPMMFGAAMAAVMGAIGMASTGPNMPIMIVDEMPTPSINVNKRRKKARSTGYIHKLPRSKREAGRRNKKPTACMCHAKQSRG